MSKTIDLILTHRQRGIWTNGQMEERSYAFCDPCDITAYEMRKEQLETELKLAFRLMQKDLRENGKYRDAVLTIELADSDTWNHETVCRFYLGRNEEGGLAIMCHHWKRRNDRIDRFVTVKEAIRLVIDLFTETISEAHLSA